MSDTRQRKKPHICWRDGLWVVINPRLPWTGREKHGVREAYHFAVRLNGGRWRKDLLRYRQNGESFPRLETV